MIILRQKEFGGNKENNNFAWEHLSKSSDNGGSGPIAVNGKVYKSGSSEYPEPEKVNGFLRTLLWDSSDRSKMRRIKGNLMYPTMYRDSQDEGVFPRVYGSSPKTSYKDSYRGFLRNEEALNNYRGNNFERLNEDLKPLTNEDIKNGIRKLARKEAIKKWGGIGLASTAIIGTGAYLLHRRNKKKREEEERKRSDY